MKCIYSLEELIGYLDGQMCDQEKENIQKHLETCQDCRNHIEALKLTDVYIKENVKNDGTTYIKVMEAIDKNRYKGKKSKYKVGAAFYKLAPVLKPIAAIVLVMIIAAAALSYREQISDVLSSIEDMFIKHDEKDNDNTEIEETNDYIVYEKDNVTNVAFETCVTKEVWGKKGPGESYENIVKIPHGRVISVIGRFSNDPGWYLAKLTPELSDDGTEIPLSENQTEFWLNHDLIEPGYEHVNFDRCTVSDASRFNHVITGKNNSNGKFHLKQLPDENCPTVSIAAQGNLISVIRKDEKWSLVKIISGRAMTDYCDTGWIKNDDYAEYKPGIKVNQGFITRPFRVYGSPDTNSDYPPLDNVIKSNIAPVNIIDESKVTDGWTHVHGGVNGITGWVKNEDIKFSLTPEEAERIANPEVDLNLLTQKIKEDIISWDNLNLCALDLGMQIKLTYTQKAELAQKLTKVTGYQTFEGGLTTFREAVYPFYTLQFLDGNDDFYMDEDTAEPPYKYYRSSFCKFNFIVTGEDTLMIQIPDYRLGSYGLIREGAPVKFIKVNKEFIEQLKKLIPVKANDDKNSFNYLLNAVKVEVNGLQSDEPQQVYKAERVLNSFAEEKLTPGSLTGNEIKVMEFKFTFNDGSIEKVIVYEKHLEYRGMSFSLNGNPESIEGLLFAGYF
ncbi:MAG TPA: zf-HC2 domain-containing protein [Pseudobacteroides sp.]|nr:zf-HC2 domain-containing protein [Pseudobacteroides sp.]